MTSASVVLPLNLTRFVGRRAELATLAEAMTWARLVTLTGIGGIGKTRLAIQAARDYTARHHDIGCYFVDLGGLPDDATADDIRAQIAKAVGIPLTHLTEPAFLDALAEQPLLLVLDNCESVPTDDCVTAMLGATDGLRVLATSRCPLAIEGELLVPVATLALPENGTAQEILASEAGQLLVDRGRIATHRDVIAATAPAVAAELVTLLGGNPLSITLAASWLRTLTVEQLITRLTEDPLRALTNAGSRAHRHASQEAVLRSTYEGCSEQERQAWQASSVFAEWFDLAAAVAVISSGSADEHAVLELITSLTDRAVLEVTRTGGRARYRTQRGVLRDFGRAQLDQSPHAAQVRRAHRDYVAAQVAQATRSWLGPREVEAIAEVHDLAPDILAALESMAAVGDARGARRLCRDWIASRAPLLHGYPDWARRAQDRALPPTAPPEDLEPRDAAELVTVYAAAVWVALNQGRREAADLHLQTCHAMLDRAAHWLADADPAPAAAVRGAATFAYGNHVLLVRAHPDAIDALAQARELLRQAGPDHATSAHMATLLWAMSAGLIGDPADAREAAQLCLSEALAADAPRAIAWARWALALAELRCGCVAEASQEIITSLRLLRDLRDQWGRTWGLELRGWILAACLDASGDRVRDGDTAAWLLGSSARVQRRVGVWLPGLAPFARFHDRAMWQVTATLGSAWAQAAFAAGAEADIDSAMRCALGEQHPPLSVTIADNEATRQLTAREREVARHLILGATDPEIARVMCLSARTVESHVAHIIRKLGVESRVAAVPLLTQ
jgi:predicted ATPase